MLLKNKNEQLHVFSIRFHKLIRCTTFKYKMIVQHNTRNSLSTLITNKRVGFKRNNISQYTSQYKICSFCIIIVFWRFSPSANQWTFVTKMRTPRSEFGSAAMDQKIYVIGGYNWSECKRLADLQCFDTDTCIWTYVGEMTETLTGVAACISVLYHGQDPDDRHAIDSYRTPKTPKSPKYVKTYNRWYNSTQQFNAAEVK